MFSEKYYLVEKYNLSSYEYVGTYENMFYEFTSVMNEIYKPELPENILERFRKIFKYKFNNNTIPFEEGETFFGINYIGGDIINYDIQTTVDYNLVRKQVRWEDFIFKSEMNHLSPLKPIIDEKIGKTDDLTNYITDLTFDGTGKVTGIGVYDTNYKSTKVDSDITKIDDFTFNYTKCSSFLIFNVGGTYKMKLMCPFPILKGRFVNNIDPSKLVVDNTIDYDKHNEEILLKMIESNIITQAEYDYIKSHLSGKQIFNIDFDIDKNEKIINKTLGIVKWRLFEEL